MATNTVATKQTHTAANNASGNTSGPYTISFDYLLESDVEVRVDNTLKTQTTHYTFPSKTSIQFTSGNFPALGATIEIKRNTDITVPKVDFQDGSVLTESDLDNNSKHLLFGMQETKEDVESLVSTFVSPTAPTDVGNGARWYDTVSGRTFVYYVDVDTAQWVEANPPFDAAEFASNVQNSNVAANAAIDSTKLSFTQNFRSGSGGVARTVDNKLEDIVSVKDFGATGNGTTDDTAAIQAAITFCTNKWALYFPAGIYLVSQTLTITTNQGSIYGDGTATTFIRFNMGNTSAETDGFYLNAVQNIFIKDLTVDVKTPASQRIRAFHLYNAKLSTIEAVDIYNPDTGILVEGTYETGTTRPISNTINLFNIKVRNARASVGNGLLINNVVDIFVNEYTCNALAGSEYSSAIFIKNCQAGWFSNMDTLHGDLGLLIKAEENDIITFLFFSQCAFDKNTTDGIRIETTHSSAILKGLTFNNSWSSSNTQKGINLTHGGGVLDGVIFGQHQAVNNGDHGVRIDNGVVNVNIHNSIIAGNSATNVNTRNGIQVEAGATDFHIVNNRIGVALNYTSKHARNILINPGSSDRYVVTGNISKGFSQAQGLFDGGTGSNKVVTNNLDVA